MSACANCGTTGQVPGRDFEESGATYVCAECWGSGVLPDPPPSRLTVDTVLSQLRALDLSYRWDDDDLRVWWALCPKCMKAAGGDGKGPGGLWSLRIREAHKGAPATLMCKNGCEDADVRERLEADPDNLKLGDALILAEQASAVAHEALDRLGAKVGG